MFLFWFLYVEYFYAGLHGLSWYKPKSELKRSVYPQVPICVWYAFRLSLQRNQLRKPIHPPSGVTTLKRQKPHLSGQQLLPRATLPISCFQLSGCVLDGKTGDWRGNQSLFADSDLHPSALPAARFVAGSFRVLRLVSAALGLPVTALTIRVHLGDV